MKANISVPDVFVEGYKTALKALETGKPYPPCRWPRGSLQRDDYMRGIQAAERSWEDIMCRERLAMLGNATVYDPVLMATTAIH